MTDFKERIDMVKKHDVIQVIQSALMDGFEDMVDVSVERVSNSIIDVHMTDYNDKEASQVDFRIYIADLSHEAPIDIIKQDISRELTRTIRFI